MLCENTTFNCTVKNILEQYLGVQYIALIKIHRYGLFVIMQKADVELRQVWREWCPSPGEEDSLRMYSTANCQIALCPVGIGCYGQHTTSEA